MKYFTFELIAAANDWIDQTEKQQKKAEHLFWRLVENYHLELEKLKPMLSKPAWNFFRHGFAETGLHDGHLLSFLIGDGLDFTPDGLTPFGINRQKAIARVEFLNHSQVFHHVFELRELKRATMNLYRDEDIGSGKGIGDLYTYELTAADEEYLRLGFLFATGAEIEIEFRRLVYRRNRIKRRYDLGEIYT
jgi:hypothetical protein